MLAQFSAAGLGEECVAVIGKPVNNAEVSISLNGEVLFDDDRRMLQRQWAETSYQIQRLRDNADCADQEFDLLLEEDNPACRSSWASTSTTTSLRRTSRRACARKWPSCVSRASTARSRWPLPSTVPVLPPSTCT